MTCYSPGCSRVPVDEDIADGMFIVLAVDDSVSYMSYDTSSHSQSVVYCVLVSLISIVYVQNNYLQSAMRATVFFCSGFSVIFLEYI